MKKFLTFLLATTMGLTNLVPAFAAENENYIFQEVSVNQELKDKLEASIVRENGSIVTLNPEYKLYKVTKNSRNLMEKDAEQYALEVTANYRASKGVDSDYDESKKADASVTATMWFTERLAGDILDRIRVEFSAGSGVQVYNRTLKYRGEGTGATPTKSKQIGMYFDEEITGVYGAGLGVSATVTAKIESYGVTDSLEVSLAS